MCAGFAVAAFSDGTIPTLALIMTTAVVCSSLCYLWVRPRA